jgi:hypothetical protein
MAATQIGQDLIIGVGQTMGSYVVESMAVSDDDVKMQDVFDEDGVHKTRIVMQIKDKITLALIPMSGATPATDFVKGGICAVAPLSNYYIEEMSYERTEGAARVRVTGINLGIT